MHKDLAMLDNSTVDLSPDMMDCAIRSVIQPLLAMSQLICFCPEHGAFLNQPISELSALSSPQ